MSSKQRLTTLLWCIFTMLSTTFVSHGHLIVREILAHWPQADSWEGRFENALYTQGAFFFLASFVVSIGLLVRGYFVRLHVADIADKDRAQRERHERAAAERHEAMLVTLTSISGNSLPKKLPEPGVKPR